MIFPVLTGSMSLEALRIRRPSNKTAGESRGDAAGVGEAFLLSATEVVVPGCVSGLAVSHRPWEVMTTKI